MTSPPQATEDESVDNAKADTEISNQSKQNDFGILDIQPNQIEAPPKFTEEATISAMRNLGIQPNDLVPSSGRSFDLNDSDNTGMKFQIALEMEKRRFEAIEKIIAERNRILENPTNVEIKIPAITAIADEEPKMKKKSTRKSGRKKRVKRSIPDSNSISPSNSKRQIKRRQLKPFSRNRNKNQQLPSQLRKNDESPTSRRKSYRSDNNNNKDFQFMQVTHTKSIRKKPAVDPQFVVERVRLNQEKREQQLEKHRQLIKKQAKLRMQKSKEEEMQMAKIKEDLKSKRDEKLKRQERMYMKLLDKKRKAFENDKKKRQEKIYQKAKLDTKSNNNSNEQRFSKLKQKMLEMQSSCRDSDLFSVTRPMNPKAPGPISDFLSSDIESVSTKEIAQNYGNKNRKQIHDAMLISDSASEMNGAFHSEVIYRKPLLKYSPLSSTNPPILQDVKIAMPAKARSSLQENPPQQIIKNNPGRQTPTFYRRLLKLPVVGKNKTRIPCLRR